jgi:hypothetical protein
MEMSDTFALAENGAPVSRNRDRGSTDWLHRVAAAAATHQASGVGYPLPGCASRFERNGAKGRSAMAQAGFPQRGAVT